MVENLKKWISNSKGHQVFEKNIQIVKVGKRLQFEMDLENIL